MILNRKEFLLGFHTAVVVSFWRRFHSKGDCDGVFHVELQHEIFQEPEKVLTNGQRRFSCYGQLFHVRHHGLW